MAAVTIFATICATTVSSISTAIPYWITGDVVSEAGVKVHVHIGLWKTCVEKDEISDCVAYTEVSGWMKSVRALMICGTISFGIGLLLLCIFARNETNHTAANICIFALLAGGTKLIAAVIDFACNAQKGDAYSYGSAFYLPISAAVVAMLVAATVHRVKRLSGYTEISA